MKFPVFLSAAIVLAALLAAPPARANGHGRIPIRPSGVTVSRTLTTVRAPAVNVNVDLNHSRGLSGHVGHHVGRDFYRRDRVFFRNVFYNTAGYAGALATYAAPPAGYGGSAVQESAPAYPPTYAPTPAPSCDTGSCDQGGQTYYEPAPAPAPSCAPAAPPPTYYSYGCNGGCNGCGGGAVYYIPRAPVYRAPSCVPRVPMPAPDCGGASYGISAGFAPSYGAGYGVGFAPAFSTAYYNRAFIGRGFYGRGFINRGLVFRGAYGRGAGGVVRFPGGRVAFGRRR